MTIADIEVQSLHEYSIGKTLTSNENTNDLSLFAVYAVHKSVVHQTVKMLAITLFKVINYTYKNGDYVILDKIEVAREKLKSRDANNSNATIRTFILEDIHHLVVLEEPNAKLLGYHQNMRSFSVSLGKKRYFSK